MSAFTDQLDLRTQDITREMGGAPISSIEAHHPEHGKVGEMFWHHDDHMLAMGRDRPPKLMNPKGLIRQVVVNPEHQRQGVATAMWNHAKTITPELHHSTNQSDAGRAWAQKTSSLVVTAADWHAIRAEHQSVHRGFGMELSDADHELVHDPSRPLAERAQHLTRLATAGNQGFGRTQESGVGTHWSTDENVAHHFAKEDARDRAKYDFSRDEKHGVDSDGYPRHRPETRLVLHAHFPEQEHINQNAHADGVFGYDEYNDIHPLNTPGAYEREVPVHKGAPVRIHAISWGLASHRSDEERPHDRETSRYDFPETQHHTAARGGDVWWHGTASGDLRGGDYGLHVGTHGAATEALTARIGHPVHGEWDGTRRYGDTLLQGQATIRARGGYPTGHNCRAPEHDHYPDPAGHFPHDSHVTPDSTPNIFPLRIHGPMANSPHDPETDRHANDHMARHRGDEHGTGLYYRNVGEDAGSVSAVVPHQKHIEAIPRGQKGVDYRSADRHTRKLTDADYDHDDDFEDHDWDDEDDDWGHHHGKTAYPPRRYEHSGVPFKRIFGPTHGLDKRLFDGDHLKPAVRADLMRKWHEFCDAQGLGDPDEWSIVYFAGSEASEWTSEERVGNNDFDVLVGVDLALFCSGGYGQARQRRAAHLGWPLTQVGISAGLTEKLRETPGMVMPNYRIPGGKDDFDQTWYVNPGSYHIADIKPYAAYDCTHDVWAVKPPHLPGWKMSDFPEGPALEDYCWGVEDMARATLDMPVPYRYQEGYALWEFVHANRSDAFGPQGEGWYDVRNVVEKWLDQKGLMNPLWELHNAATQNPGLLDAPADWSNTPVMAMLIRSMLSHRIPVQTV